MGQKKKQKSYLKIGDIVQIISGQKKGCLAKIIFLNRKEEKISVQEIDENDSNTKLESILIHRSNIMFWDPEKKIATRVGYKIINSEKKRYSKKSGNFI